MSVLYFEGIGRRKQSIARVRIMAGTGRFIVNDKEAPAFFNRLGDFEAILAPMKAAGQDTKTYDITVIVNGGGVTGHRSHFGSDEGCRSGYQNLRYHRDS